MARADQLTLPAAPRPAGVRLQGLAACVVLAAALHLVLLSLGGESAPAYSPRHGAARVVPVRLRLPAVGPAHAAPTSLPARQARKADTAVLPATPAAADVPLMPPVTVAPTLPMPVTANAGEADATSDGPPGFDAYLPAAILTMTPAPTVPVDIPYPAFDGDSGHYRAELTLFVDETGLVQRIDIGLGALPPALEAAVRRTFMAASFRPGEVDGVPVRSRIRIEVRFDSGSQRH